MVAELSKRKVNKAPLTTKPEKTDAEMLDAIAKIVFQLGIHAAQYGTPMYVWPTKWFQQYSIPFDEVLEVVLYLRERGIVSAEMHTAPDDGELGIRIARMDWNLGVGDTNR